MAAQHPAMGTNKTFFERLNRTILIILCNLAIQLQNYIKYIIKQHKKLKDRKIQFKFTLLLTI